MIAPILEHGRNWERARSLLERAQTGDQDAWRTLIAKYQSLVYSIPKRMGLGYEDCEDVFQSTFTALASNLQKIRAEEALGRTLSETIIPSRDREAHRRGLARFLATGEGPILGRRVEVTALHRDGREFPVELTATAARVRESWVFNAFLRDTSPRASGRSRFSSLRTASRRRHGPPRPSRSSTGRSTRSSAS